MIVTKVRSVFICLILLSSCNNYIPKEDNSELIETPTGDSFHWNSIDFPITVVLHPSLDSELSNAIFVAMETWNRNVGETVFVGYTGSYYFRMFRGELVRGHVSVQQKELGSSYNLYTQGRTFIQATSGTRGRIHSVRMYLDEDLSSYRMKFAVSLHELGHALGLAHDEQDDKSVMWWSIERFDAHIQTQDLRTVRRMVKF